MFPEPSQKAKLLLDALKDFVENDCIPAEPIFHSQIKHGEDRWKSYPAIMEDLKKKAKNLGLWNLFLSKEYPEGADLTNLEYAVMSEIMGRSIRLAPEACNCSAPDTGNMEVFSKYGNDAQKKQWLQPLLDGKIRSAFAMTEPAVASSDATNVETVIKRDGNDYVINGRKWYITGAGDPRCKVLLVLGKTDPNNKHKHKQQSVIIVPRDTPGVEVVRPLGVFGYDDAPCGHVEIDFKDVRVPASNLILGEGRGFEVIQGRLGPGRIHHCMRALGAAERSLELMLLRSTTRSTFGKKLADHGLIQTEIAECRTELEKCRLLVLNAAHKIDQVGAKKAWREIAIAKIAVPNSCLQIMDKAIQVFGAAGVSQDTPLAELYASIRTLRIADGPDAVHQMQIARSELKLVPSIKAKYDKYSSRTKELIKVYGESKL
ncbi:acyl-CoA dehydrogenase NM domain-like protein [Neoconidiobolus thromboides FSU 785]|nr:acyl-CoA dehydrogenase NM domain-like protein [Neoconidiobolus thromboides FSU 785]